MHRISPAQYLYFMNLDVYKRQLDAETKAKVLEEQRAWIKQKEARVKGAGMEVNGGSLQPQLENTVAEEITRARACLLYTSEKRTVLFW